MPILPSGRKKIMEAQYPIDGAETDMWGTSELGPSSEYPSQQTPSMPPQKNIEEVQEKKKDDGGPDLTEYIFKKLEGYGYPPRRLEEFSEEFVVEKIYPDGFKEITVTLPDKYFGMRRRLPERDVQEIVNEIQDQFKLALTQATRKEKKIIMEFNSQAKLKHEEQEKQQLGTPQDDLDEIFGVKGQKKERQKRQAKTIKEMIKESRSFLIHQLTKLANGEI